MSLSEASSSAVSTLTSMVERSVSGPEHDESWRRQLRQHEMRYLFAGRMSLTARQRG